LVAPAEEAIPDFTPDASNDGGNRHPETPSVQMGSDEDFPFYWWAFS
jgi:hypothetical protein